jgi:hypothetical protein
MIIPTPDFDPLFAEDGRPFREKMVAYIEREFADVLGSHTGLLHSDQGLETLSRLYVTAVTRPDGRRNAA